MPNLKKELEPNCPKCGEKGRPHTLFFDESYQEEFYRSNTAVNLVTNIDCLFVIGTKLETSLAAKIVGNLD